MKVLCPECDGAGGYLISNDDIYICQYCDGTGLVDDEKIIESGDPPGIHKMDRFVDDGIFDA